MKQSHVPWLQDIPTEWTVERGKTILNLEKRPVRETDEVITCFRDGEVVLRSERRTEGFTMADKEIGYQGINKGDIVIHGMDGFAGAMGVSKSTGKGSPVLVVCTPKYDAVPQFLIYYLRALAMTNVFVALATGIRERSCDLRWNKIAELDFILPPAIEQQAIADFLDKKCSEIDEMISLQEKIIEELKAYKQSVITEVVRRGLNPSVPMKDSGIKWIGQIPEGWNIYRIKYNTFLKGRIGWQGLNSADFIDEGYCLITGTDFDNKGGIHWDTCYRISKERFDEDELLHIKEGDLLMTKDGTVGKMAYIKNLPEEASLNSHLLIIRQTTPLIKNAFLYWIMLSEEFKGFCSIYQSGSIMNSVSQSTLGQFSCSCPPLEEQQDIVDYLEVKCNEIDSLISVKQSKIEALKEYKKSIIYEYITGKKEVPYGE